MQKNTKFGRGWLLCSVAAGSVAAAGMLGGAAFADDGAAASDELIVVTGSRIQRSGMTTPTPVTAVSANELNAMAPTILVEAFDQMPQFLNNDGPQTQGNFAGAAGSANLNVRGIGSNRTLVLLDGRRVVSANRLGTVDINLFPRSMIRSVEVVTGGASAAYGSDAVAGVVNFILDTDFEGFEATAQAGITDRGDGESGQIGASAGFDLGDKAHMIVSGEYFQQAGINSPTSRDWYQGWGLVTNPDPTGPTRLVVPNVVSTEYTFGGLINAPGNGDDIPPSAIDRLMFLSDGSATPFIESGLGTTAPGTLRSQSIANGGSGDNVKADLGGQGGLLPDIERSSLFAYADYDVSSNLTLYGQGIYGRSQTHAPGNSPVLFSIWGGTIYSGNAYLPDSVQAVMDDEGLESFGFTRMHSSADLARGTLTQTNTTTSFTGGFEYEVTGGFLSGWNVDGYAQYGKNENRIVLGEFIRTDRLFQSMDAVVDPATGATVCYATLMGNPEYDDCVPVNLFGAGNVSDEAMDYLLGPDKTVSADITQVVAELSASGEIYEGWGAGAISGAVGVSYKEDELDQVVGPQPLVFAGSPGNGELGVRGMPPGFNNNPSPFQFSTAQDIAGSYDVSEVFAETLIPVFSDLPGIDQFDVNLAARYANYSGSGGVWAYKAGADWQIYSDLRLRSTFSRDVRAANLSERFDSQSNGATADDPEFGDQSFSLSQVVGGNPNVAPEEADTFTVGFVYQPSFFDGFSASVDYYSIDITGAIGQLGVQRIIDDCFEGAQELCAQIERDPVTNELVRVYNIFQNIDAAAVSGIDWEVAYQRDIDIFGGGESIRARVLGSALDENSTTNLGAPKDDVAGEVGVSGFPDHKITASLTYDRGPFSLFLQERYISPGENNREWVEGVDIDNNQVDEVFYTDMRLSWTRPTGASEVELFGNVTNVFDEAPPIVAGWSSFAGAVQYNDSIHDVLGRRYTVGARVRY